MILNASAQQNTTLLQTENLTSISKQTEPGSLRVIATGYSQPYSTSARIAFVVENGNNTTTYEYSKYQVAAYDASGAVVGTSNGVIDLIFPEERLGVSTYMSIPANAQIAELDIQVLEGDKKSLKTMKNPLSAENIRYFPDLYSSKVTGIIRSSWDKDIESVQVTAISYDENGDIIDGGSGYVQFVPASGQAAFEIMFTSGIEPAKVELYPSASYYNLMG